MARPEPVARHVTNTTPHARYPSRGDGSVSFPATPHVDTACPPWAAEAGRAAPSGEAEIHSPIAASSPGDGDDAAPPPKAPLPQPTGAKRGPKPARGRLILLPSQFFADAREDFRLPERRLMLAILLDAVECM